MTQNIVSVNEWRKPSRSIILTILVLVIFFILSQYNFLIFHSLAEMVSIVIAWGVFMLVWNSRRIINNDNLVSLGIALLFVGLIDGLHTLAYQGMGIFDTELSTNYATQLWIVARVLQSLSLLLFTSFLRSMIKPSYMFIGYLAITVGLLLSIFLWNLFPVCYVEGSGLTSFKVIAEYFIVLVIICSLILIRHNRHKFDKMVYQMMVAAMITTIATELTFTLYVDVYGVLNILGHVLKILSFIFIYNALVSASLIRPYETMFRQLEREKRAVENSEKQLNNTNAKQEALIKNISDVIGIVDQKGINRYKSSNVEKWFGWKPQELIGKDTWANVHADDLEQVQAAFGTILQNDLAVVTAEYRYLCKNGDYKWIEATATNLISDKNINGILLNYHDITERKQAEEELVGTKFVLDTTTDAVYWMQQDGQFVDVNDAACKKLGYTRDELLAMHVNDMNPDYPADRWPATWELIKKEKSVNIEAHHKTKDGLVFPVEIQANYVQFGDKERICSYVRDITERKQAENNLRESENRYRALVENAPICIHEIDLSGKIISMNRSGLDMLDLNNEADVLGLTYIDAVGADDRPIIEGLLRKALKGESSHFEFQGSNPERLVYYQSSFIPIKNKDGEVVRLMGMSEDITDRKMVEKAVQESEERVAALADASKEAIFFSEKGVCLDQNHAAERMFGYSREEAVGKMGTDWIIPEHREVVIQNMLSEFEGPYEVDALRKDGSTFYAEIRAGISRYMGSDVRVTALRDVTRRKQAEQAQLVMKAQLHQAQKLEAIGTMVGGISHEFNNVLQSMFLYASLVQSDLPKNEVLRSNFQHILDDGNRAKDLIKQVLTFSRKTKVELKTQPLHELVKEVLVLERASLPANIDIQQDIDMNCGLVQCDKTQIHQIMINLCNNAQHAMEEKGGTLTVSLQQTQASMNNGDPKTDVLELTVSDTGHGIDAPDLERIFDPFFTTKEVGKGTGLGLSVIHGIVEMMDGQISVTSKRGKGTTFRIIFPVTEAVSEEHVIESGRQADVVSRSILLVDDEDSIRLATHTILKRKGFTVDSASDGKQALELFKANSGKYNLIVTDQSMPKMSGIELTKAIRNTKSDIPIILSTGQLGIEDEKEFKDIGINSFIQKPWTAEELIERIQGLEYN